MQSRETSSAIGDRRVTLEHLRAFVTVAEAGGFQQAGDVLHRSQSAITQSLKRLESILGCRLLERSQGHVLGLTAQGRRLLPAASNILVRTDEAIVAMLQTQITGRIALGVPDDVRIVDLHGAVSRCTALNPNLRIEMTSALSSNLASGLQKGELDLAILKHCEGENPFPTTWRTLILRTEPLLWVASDRRCFDAIREIPLVAFPSGCCYRDAALRLLTKCNKSSYFAYVSASYENVRAAVSAGLGIGILPQSAVAPDHQLLGETEGFPSLPDVHLVAIQIARQKIISQFLDFLRTTIGRKSSMEELKGLQTASVGLEHSSPEALSAPVSETTG